MTNNPVELQDAIERVEMFAEYLEEGWVVHAGPRPDRLDPADLRTILSALSVSGDMRWQPIESAPKDGSLIWLATSGSLRVGRWRAGEQYECRGSIGGGWQDFHLAEAQSPCDLQFTPSHWMPVPKPPTLSSQHGEPTT